MWDPPRPGLEPVSPALAGRFLTTAPPGKPYIPFLEHSMAVSQHLGPNQVRPVGGVQAWVTIVTVTHGTPTVCQALGTLHITPVASSTLGGDESEVHLAEAMGGGIIPTWRPACVP